MKKNLQTPPRAFTLIELLIVVAIIAILAAIAVPNFLEAQIRAKVSRVRADHRTIATAIESYRVDWNRPPPTPYDSTSILAVIPDRLSTPVSYISSSEILDPFITELGNFEAYDNFAATVTIFTYTNDPSAPTDTEALSPTAGRRFYYGSNNESLARRSQTVLDQQEIAQIFEGEWILGSFGPSKVFDEYVVPDPRGGGGTVELQLPYDSSNGTISPGNIIRSQKEPEGTLQPN